MRAMRIPSYEPTAALIDLLCQLRGAKLKAVVVDDDSDEGYVKIFEDASLFSRVCRLDQVKSKQSGEGCHVSKENRAPTGV